MPCNPEELKHVPLFEKLDDEELAILAQQVELRKFAARQRIYKMGDAGERGYIMISGKVQVATVDDDQQEVVIDEPTHGDFFGFAAMLDQIPHDPDPATHSVDAASDLYHSSLPDRHTNNASESSESTNTEAPLHG